MMHVVSLFACLFVLPSIAHPTDTPAASPAGASEVPQYPFRFLPADVLRDFPDMCFGSTALRLFQVGQSWSLSPFCGVATCLDSETGHFVERVQDCGIQPKPNDKCTNVNANSTKEFPACCPKFECEEGVELEYPTQEELQELAASAFGQVGAEPQVPGTTTAGKPNLQKTSPSA